MKTRLPTPPDDIHHTPALIAYLRQLIQALERAYERTTDLPLMKDRIKITNLTKQFALDCTAGTLNDVRMTLGTLISELQVNGKLP